MVQWTAERRIEGPGRRATKGGTMKHRHSACVAAMVFTLSAATLASVACGETAQATKFVHPGGLHTLVDLERVKARVAAGDRPWIDSWNALIKDRKAQLSYEPAPRANMGASRQRAAADAVAAYLNAVRGYVSGDVAYTDQAIRICNQWSGAVNQVPSGADQPGLNGIYTYQFAVVGEMLRIHVGTRWKQEDFDRFKKMMRTYLYPPCHDFLVRHNGACISHYWANWDAANIAAIGAMGVLCDDRALFDEAVEYFKNGAGNGSIKHAVHVVHPGNLGQWQETGRDQEHNVLGIGLLGAFCEIARNQGLDLYGYNNNRLLAGAEYVAAYNMWKPVPYAFYNNCDNVNHYWASRSQRGRLQRPIWEQLYNHYVVRQGLHAPNLTAMAALNRPEGFTHDDHFGYGTLMYTLRPSGYPPAPIPAAPTDVSATAGVGRVFLKWSPPATANGFVVRRATKAGGPYTELSRYRGVIPEYYDRAVENGTTYWYVVAAENQSGTSGDSAEVSAIPVATGQTLPDGWLTKDIGTVAAPGGAEHASAGQNTFIVRGAGSNIGGATNGRGGNSDGIGFTHTALTGDGAFTVRLIDAQLRGAGRSSRIGIMIRASLDPDAACVTLLLGDLGYREARFGTRAKAGASMSFVPGNGYSGVAQFPTWFRLERTGNTLAAWQSDDGQTWHKVGSSAVPMGRTVYAGLAIASGSAETIGLTVDHVSVKSAAAEPGPGGIKRG
jgi:hypothetical protein